MCIEIIFFFFEGYGDHRDLHSFPTRRSSDLAITWVDSMIATIEAMPGFRFVCRCQVGTATFAVTPRDRKSTRLNSSHANISYAVFCLKKKKTIKNMFHTL